MQFRNESLAKCPKTAETFRLKARWAASFMAEVIVGDRGGSKATVSKLTDLVGSCYLVGIGLSPSLDFHQ